MLTRESGLTIGDEGGDGCLGDLALCCTEPKKLKPRDEDPDPGSSEGREFQALIRKYMENPTCPVGNTIAALKMETSRGLCLNGVLAGQSACRENNEDVTQH
ncbi:chitinase [Metarhizium album ARSEF 1941]|uniref:Chitinase n=1 Tax=Metarhizium album (strain ARSEF 1941) TaxID=1081103 RepID=A0A0B2WND4_METAS|nr:chitinase [Metarhizium album ARSEF 1941]KHN95169.1 chitinase [Metarhizium album ARSEF 1941]